MYYVYLLKSLVDHKFYIGQTDNISKRLNEHNYRREKSTKSRAPFKLLGYETYLTRREARWRETELKRNAHKRKQFYRVFDGGR